jgi:subtilisin
VELEKRLDQTGPRAIVRVKDSVADRSTQRTVVRRDDTDPTRIVPKGVLAALSAQAADRALAAIETLGIQIIRYYDRFGMAWVAVPAGAADPLSRSPFVDFVSPEATAQLLAQTTPWGIDSIKAPLAWAYTTGAGAKLLIIDQGHDQGHEDLPFIAATHCFGGFGGCDNDEEAHGAHVFGIAAALNNSLGVVGVAPGIGAASIWIWGACQFGFGCPYGEIVAALNWAAGNLTPRGVINMSFSGPDDQAQATAIAGTYAADIVVVAAAGNQGDNAPQYPAATANVIGVAGMLQNKTFPLNDNAPCPNADDPHPGSSWGAHVDLAAPWDALSTVANNQYAGPEAGWCGTSMAAPHVAGLAVLIRAYNPSLSAFNVFERLRWTARDLGTYGRDDYFGWGMARHLAVGYSSPVITATVSAGKPRLTWPAVPFATSYQIWRWVTPQAPTAVLWATVTGTSYTDYSTKVTSFYGYNTFPSPPAVSVSYQVKAMAEELAWASAYATFLPNGTPPY